MERPPGRFIYIFDTYVLVWADSKEEADHKLEEIESVINAVPTASLQIFDSFGIEDSQTGEELRSVH